MKRLDAMIEVMGKEKANAIHRVERDYMKGIRLHPYLGYAGPNMPRMSASTAVFGGSTAWGMGAGGVGIASHISGATNFAVPGYVAQQNLIQLAINDPIDQAILLNGVNEAISAILNDPDGFPLQFRQVSNQWRRKHRTKQAPRRSIMSASMAARRILSKAWARADRFSSIMCLQPYVGIGKKVLTPLEERLLEHDRSNFPEMPEVYRNLRSMCVYDERVDLCDVFEHVTETVYLDSCHLTPMGYEILAARIKEEL